MSPAMTKINLTVFALFFAAPLCAPAQTIQHGLRVPAGFEVVEYADSKLANDIYCLTIDPKGRVIVAGCVLRFSPDFKDCEIVAQGFRNPYCMDFNLDGELFTFDSDNERCVSLPWYEPTRLYHVIPGGHYGWLAPQRANFWRMPPYFPDVVAPIATLGRGSPTGVVCYRHTQFPKEYRGGFFLGDWTFGRIYFAPLQRKGASYVSEPKVFLESVGDNGFAPTGLAVHPITGDLFVSIGGRGTRGAVYRIRYSKGMTSDLAAEAAMIKTTAPAQIANPPKRDPNEIRVVKIPPNRPDPMTVIRLLQISYGDIGAPSARGTVWEGYTSRIPPVKRMQHPKYLQWHPGGDRDQNREILRI